MLHFGELDGVIPLDQVDKIGEPHPDVEVHVYEGAQHGFSCDVHVARTTRCRRRSRSAARSTSSHGVTVIIDCHGHYTTAPPQLGEYRDAQKARRAPSIPPTSVRRARSRSPTTRSATASSATSSGCSASAAPTSRCSRRGRAGWSTTSATAHVAVLVRALQRADPPDLRSVPRQLRPGVPAPAVARGADRLVGARAASLRRRDGFRRLQPQPRSVGWVVERADARRPRVLAAVRGDVRARRAGDDPRQRRRAIRTSTPPARTTSAPTRRRSCRR